MAGLCCCVAEKKEWPENAKALIVAICLFTLITAVQFVAAIVSNSDALLVDCASMLVDAMTYVFNLHAECKGREETQSLRAIARRALVSSGFSIVVLYGITAWGLSDAIGTLAAKHVVDDLDPTIVLVFGVLGVVFDGATLAAFKAWGFNPEGVADDSFGLGASADQQQQPLGADENENPKLCGLSRRESSLVNMCSALTHVVADSIRSLTSILLGLVVMLDHSVNGSVADGYATLIVASTIILGNVPLCRAWARAFRTYYDADKNSERRRQNNNNNNKKRALDMVHVSNPPVVTTTVTLTQPRNQERKEDPDSNLV